FSASSGSSSSESTSGAGRVKLTMSFLQSLSLPLSLTYSCPFSFGRCHSRTVIGMKSLARTPHCFTIFCATPGGSVVVPSSATLLILYLSCSPNFLAGTHFVLTEDLLDPEG